MMPLTNSQIAAKNKATQGTHRTKDGAPPIPTVLNSYSYGRYQLVWDARGAAEVRVGNTVLHSGTRDECAEWIGRM